MMSLVLLMQCMYVDLLLWFCIVCIGNVIIVIVRRNLWAY